MKFLEETIEIYQKFSYIEDIKLYRYYNDNFR